jgi:hypothetical protein
MKKTFLAVFVALLAMLVVACDGFAPQNDGIPSVQYTTDGNTIKSVMLRLDGEGGAGQNMSRALTDNLAKAGHDYFEVVFFKSATELARASWELGDAAGIKNVPRNFAYESIGGVADATKAILFVGRKADKTLLAVGLLTAVDNLSTDLTITPTSKTATFTVTALTAGANITAATSSFWTAAAAAPTGVIAAAGTNIEPVTDRNTSATFPMYRIPANVAQTNASYTIDCTDTTTVGGLVGINKYLPGILIAAVPPGIQPRIPRFPRGGGLAWELEGPFAASTKVIFEPASNNVADLPLTAATNFRIATNSTPDQEGVIAFTFAIPVYAINKAEPAGVPKPITWEISPSFGRNRYDLDDGKGSLGGSILLGIGNNVTLNWLEVIGTP